MRHPELPIVSFLTILLLLCSLPSHIRAGSVAIIALVAWLAIVNFIRGVNALAWAGNVVVKLEVWCDITTKITVGFTYAIPASTLCILRHLESVASTRNVRSTNADKRLRQKFEAVMCFGLPIIGMGLHYVVQGHRLDLIEDFGCYPPVYFSVAAIMILWVPPFAMSLITFGYAAVTLRHFLQRRIEFATHLRNSQSAISPARYVRLMAMAVVEMIWDTGVNAYLIYFNSFTGLRPWTNWNDVHSNFSRVAIFPSSLIPPMFVTQLIWQWWIVPVSSILFFIFFGFGEEAMSDYRAIIIWLRQTVLRQKMQQPHAKSAPVLPTYHHHLPQPPVGVALSDTEDVQPEDSMKGWDEWSLKMPHTPSYPGASVLSTAGYPGCLVMPAEDSSVAQDAKSLSLDDSVSLNEPQESCLTSPTSSLVHMVSSAQPSSMHDNTTPSVFPGLPVVYPGVGIHSVGGIGFAEPRTPPVYEHPVPLSIISRPARFRRSISTDLGITVSQAYPPDVDTALRYHEQAFLTLDGSRDGCPSRRGTLHPHGERQDADQDMRT